MSVTIGRYLFEGPYFATEPLQDRSGVYAIIDRRDTGDYLVDVGESATLRTRVENHDRKDCWSRNAKGTLGAAAYYTPNLQQPGRMDIEQEIRGQYDLACGKR